METQQFSATIEILGVNPFVPVPPQILQAIFRQAGKRSGAIPVRGSVNSVAYRQTLVRYLGEWRFYINTTMLKNSPKRVGERIDVTIEYDPETREIPMPEAFRVALEGNPAAQEAFDRLSRSRRGEIIRYLAKLKTEESRSHNIARALAFLLGKGPFVGRQKP